MILDSGTLSANGHGGQTYFSSELLGDSRCPLIPGDACVAQVVPEIGVLVVPAGARVEYPIAVPNPRRIDPETPLDDVPLKVITREQ